MTEPLRHSIPASQRSREPSAGASPHSRKRLFRNPKSGTGNVGTRARRSRRNNSDAIPKLKYFIPFKIQERFFENERRRININVNYFHIDHGAMNFVMENEKRRKKTDKYDEN